MDIKKEDPSKVIIIPRPPRSMDHEMVPIKPANEAPEALEDEEPLAGPAALTGPGVGPMNNHVEGPAIGLAGAPKPDEEE